MSSFPPLHILSPETQHTHTCICIHGRGSNGPEFATDLFSFDSSQGRTLQEHFPSWKWVFPSAQERWSTPFEGLLSEWFDIYSLTDPEEQPELQIGGLSTSVGFLSEVIASEAAIVGVEKVFLLGISQGCATGLHVLLSGSAKVRAFVGISGWLPFRQKMTDIFEEHDPEAQKKLYGAYQTSLGIHARADIGNIPPKLTSPVFWGHGTDDSVVDVNLGKLACRVFETAGMEVTLKTYDDCGHWAKEPEGYDDIIQFLSSYP
jgi:lysophospholipase-2